MNNIVEQNTLLVPIPSEDCKHLFIVLTNPEGEPPIVVMVNITTRKPTSDSTVVLTQGDHPFVHHESIIAFEHGDFFPVSRLENGLNNGKLKKYSDISDNLFSVIKQGLLASPRTPQRVKNYCLERLRASVGCR